MALFILAGFAFCFLCHRPACVASSSNPNLDTCELTVYNGINYTDSSFGPFSCSSYEAENGDFDNDEIESAILTSYSSNLTCWAYLFWDNDFEGDCVLLSSNSTAVEQTDASNTISTLYFNDLDRYFSGWSNDVTSMKLVYEDRFCQVLFYTSDHQTDQTGPAFGIAGTYTKNMFEV